MKLTMLDVSVECDINLEGIVPGDLVVTFSFDNKDDAGLCGRNLAHLLYKEVEFVKTVDGVLIKEV